MIQAAHSSFFGHTPVAPSAIAIEGQTHDKNNEHVPYEVPKELSIDEIGSIVEDYRVAAQRAKDAGFDGVEVHGANGYLVDEFLQSSTNKRTDSYGGSVENRFRFAKEVLEAVSSVWPSQRVGIRISPNGIYNSMGSEDNIETFSFALSQFNRMNLAYVHIMDGLAFGFHNKCKVFRLNDARRVYDGTLIGNCGYTKEKAEGALGTGCVDFIAFGRPFISNPDLVERFRNNYPLAADAPFSTYYSHPAGHPEVGYSDFPTYSA